MDSLTPTAIASLQLTDDESNVLYNGSTVYYMLREYAARYMIVVDQDTFLFKWAAYNGYKLPDFRRAYAALYAEYNPLDNYDMTEKSVDLNNHGEKTHTRSVDTDHNTVTTSSEYDYTQETSTDSNDKPTTKNYTTTYDSAITSRLAGYTESSGKTSQRTTADGDNNNTVVTDDMTIVNAETHDTTQMTIDGTTYTADDITAHELTRRGNIGVTSSMQLIESELQLRAKSLLYDYIYDFISRYTFYASGGECYDNCIVQ